MRRILGMLPLLLLSWALEVGPTPSLELRVSARLSFNLFPQAVVVERFPEPEGIVVVYHEDLRRKGWVRVR